MLKRSGALRAEARCGDAQNDRTDWSKILEARPITDKSTFQDPAQYAEGIKFVIVNGVLVVKDGQLQSDVHPDRPVRATF